MLDKFEKNFRKLTSLLKDKARCDINTRLKLKFLVEQQFCT